MSFILNVAPVGLLISATGGSAAESASLSAVLFITQFLNQVKVEDTSQLINGMSSVLQKLLKYVNGTTISSSFLLLLFCNFSLMLFYNQKTLNL